MLHRWLLRDFEGLLLPRELKVLPKGDGEAVEPRWVRAVMHAAIFASHNVCWLIADHGPQAVQFNLYICRQRQHGRAGKARQGKSSEGR
jgi:hypothetical protein